ncbi:hypothetical protein T07_2191 [Trichinella nelsoni]|uniref:Uncharacterized protein n=1 Tax=Trichinella nelsoni TaxID=6336 RepID=A0A0V0S5P8_9BILA|nr:hypothetical protein T07_2191 [Trichinella nelsoni]
MNGNAFTATELTSAQRRHNDDEVAFFGNYALLNIQLLLFNSYHPDSQIQVKATWLTDATHASSAQSVLRCVFKVPLWSRLQCGVAYGRLRMMRACENESRILNAPHRITVKTDALCIYYKDQYLHIIAMNYVFTNHLSSQVLQFGSLWWTTVI